VGEMPFLRLWLIDTPKLFTLDAMSSYLAVSIAILLVSAMVCGLIVTSCRK
jgi:hypothetical protein